MRLKFIIFLFLLAVPAFSQSYNYLFSFGEFTNAEAFSINSTGNIYVTDTGTEEIFKYDTLGSNLKEAGGYGWKEGTFDDPVDIYATPLNIYICDMNNHRVQRYDKDLNFISLLYTRENDNPAEQFGYPLSIGVSGQGDLYILDSENKRVIKFDLFGNFIQNFGGYDWGEYSLSDPVKLSVSPIGYVYVLDKNRIIVYDQYGNGAAIIPAEADYRSINITFNKLSLNTENHVFIQTLNSSDKAFNEVTAAGNDEKVEFVSSLIFNNKLFVLSPKKILVFEKVD